MTISARPLSPPSSKRARTARLLLAAGSAVALLILVAAPAAQALVKTVGPVTVGVQPRISAAYTSAAEPKKYANPEGHVVLHGTSTYVIYWDPTDHYHGDWQEQIDHFMHNAGAASGSLESVFDLATQYTDQSNVPATYSQVYKSAYTDTTPYPPSGCKDPEPLESGDLIGPEVAGKHTEVCLTSAQMATEVENFLAVHNLPRGLGNEYFILTPPAVAVCLDGGTIAGHCSDYVKASEESYEHSFCSYHAAINPGGLVNGDGNTLLYAVIPWSAGGAGDPLLTREDQLIKGWPCQDGGINPAGKHGYEPEKAKVKSKKEKEEFEEKNPEEKLEQEEREQLEGPHNEEPNQPAKCPDVFDGGCDTGLADLIGNQISVEQVNMITDPLLNAWQDPNKYENSDECRFLFGSVLGGSVTANLESLSGTLYDNTLAGTNYYLNDVFNNAGELLPYPGSVCTNHVTLQAAFTAPNPVNSGEIVGLDGMESNITLNANITYVKGVPSHNYATYAWNFGDGTPIVTGFAPGAPTCEAPWLSPCAASVFHSFQYGGTYTVTLTVTDVSGNKSTVTHEITVNGPPPPGSGGSGSGSGSAAGTSAGGSGSSGGSGGPAGSASVLSPVASASVVSRSLRSVMKSGVLVAYSVNEQVAGHFEVLLSRATARRLGISGTSALGLPAGQPPSLVVAKALIVTTAGGHSKVKLFFTKRNAQLLSRQHKVSFLLRLVVRNAAPKPATATVLSSFTLVH